jgi:hypothetical protein
MRMTRMQRLEPFADGELTHGIRHKADVRFGHQRWMGSLAALTTASLPRELAVPTQCGRWRVAASRHCRSRGVGPRTGYRNHLHLVRPSWVSGARKPSGSRHRHSAPRR